MSKAAAIVALCAAALGGAPAARAGELWSAAELGAEAERARRAYDGGMLAGDDAVAEAVNAARVDVRLRLIDRAIASYELAARARPLEPEPHFRAASVLGAFFLDCGDIFDPGRPRLTPGCTTPMTPARAARLIEHWDAFERLAPGDPRVTEEILFERAVLRTKLGTDDDLRAAADDYRKLLDRRPDGQPGAVLGNLAETYMMLGDLDRAIDTYRQSLARGADLSQEFGLAVALDRDEQGAQARAIMVARGERGLATFIFEINRGHIFFVPRGEELYYLALAEEALGNVGDAIEYWDGFIASGAHPEFAPRARQNRDALRRAVPTSARGRRPRPAAPPWSP
jgi:tetratricopeptide (TPR) repeat protein